MAKRELHTVIKIGSSLGVTFPVDMCKALGIERGDTISFAVLQERELRLRVISPGEMRNLKPKFIT